MYKGEGGGCWLRLKQKKWKKGEIDGKNKRCFYARRGGDN